MFDLQLSEACHESRSVYLKTFKNSLLGNEGDTRIIFTNDTTVFITNFCELLVDIRKLDDEMHKSEGEGVHEPLYHSDIRLLGHDNLPPGENPWPGHFFPNVDLIKYYVKDYGRWKWREVHPVPRRGVSDLHLTYTEGLLAHTKKSGWEGPKIINCDPNVLCY